MHDGTTSTNPGVMLSLTNQLQFLGDYDVAADGIIGVLPEGYRPKSMTIIDVSASLGDVTKQTFVLVYPDGRLISKGGVTVNTTGFVVNLPGDWY